MTATQSAGNAPHRLADPLRDYFDTAVTPNGYRWWYLDVVSDDGRDSLVIIGFIGSVFSPYYASSRRRGRSDPFNHCAVNAILYSDSGKRWAMTERSGDQLVSDADGISIGRSSMRWLDGKLVVEIDELSNPIPRRMRGRVVLSPGNMNHEVLSLHSNGRHNWWPVAPRATATVEFEMPDRRFSGSAYLDSNFGDEPLESGFRRWDWTRRERPPADGVTTSLTYHVVQKDGHENTIALALADSGELVHQPAPLAQRLPASAWRVPRHTRSDLPIVDVKTLEDTPFYARSLLRVGDSDATDAILMHESLSLERFRSRWVQWLLPFRMPRRNTARR